MLKRIPKPLLFTIIYYLSAISLGLFFALSRWFKSGPCTPGLDFMWPFLVFIGAIILTMVFLIRTMLKKGRANFYAALVHLGMVLLTVGLLALNSKN